MAKSYSDLIHINACNVYMFEGTNNHPMQIQGIGAPQDVVDHYLQAVQFMEDATEMVEAFLWANGVRMDGSVWEETGTDDD